jgi:hypothetical protein
VHFKDIKTVHIVRDITTNSQRHSPFLSLYFTSREVGLINSQKVLVLGLSWVQLTWRDKRDATVSTDKTVSSPEGTYAMDTGTELTMTSVIDHGRIETVPAGQGSHKLETCFENQSAVSPRDKCLGQFTIEVGTWMRRRPEVQEVPTHTTVCAET